MAEAACASACGAGAAHILLFEHHNVGHTAPGEMVGDAQADDSAADHDDLSSVFHVVYKTSYDEGTRNTRTVVVTEYLPHCQRRTLSNRDSSRMSWSAVSPAG